MTMTDFNWIKSLNCKVYLIDESLNVLPKDWKIKEIFINEEVRPRVQFYTKKINETPFVGHNNIQRTDIINPAIDTIRISLDIKQIYNISNVFAVEPISEDIAKHIDEIFNMGADIYFHSYYICDDIKVVSTNEHYFEVHRQTYNKRLKYQDVSPDRFIFLFTRYLLSFHPVFGVFK